jgi:hypothetical protein
VQKALKRYRTFYFQIIKTEAFIDQKTLNMQSEKLVQLIFLEIENKEYEKGCI